MGTYRRNCNRVIMKKLLIVLIINMSLWTGRLHAQSRVGALSSENVLEEMQHVADWQLAHPTGKPLNSWEYGPFYQGIMKLYRVSLKKRYLKAMQDMGGRIKWELQPAPYDANSLAIVPALADLYELNPDSFILDKSRYLMDMPVARAIFTMEDPRKLYEPEVKLADNRYWNEWWTWCDALFMAPPAYARLAKILNRPDYRLFMVKGWWRTSDYLYSKSDSLIFRDDRFFNQRTMNGKKIFWSRGNGWVIGGLVGVLDALDKNDPDRLKFEQQFVQMCTKLAALQMENGYWSQSLLDAKAYPQKETSGTAFFCYAFAWGINQGLLPKEKFMPVLLKGWAALTSAVHEDGMLGYVQRVGDKPENVKENDSETYGSGAFLLAGCQLMKLLNKL